MNNVKTLILLTLLTTLLWWLAVSLYPQGGFWLGLVLAAVFNLGAYFFSDKFALMASRARPVSEQELPQVYGIIRMLTEVNDMPMPRIYVIDSPQPNAFATGRNPKHGVVAVTTGLLQIMNRSELEGVLAHELSHIRNRDILISSVAAMIAAALVILARMAFWFGGSRDRNNQVGAIVALVAMIVAPIAAILIRSAISRTREYQADRTGAEMTGQPLALASALNKIGIAAERIPMRVNDAVSQLYIENPLKSNSRRRGGGVMKLLSTHPPIDKRIAVLEHMADPFS
ncbi:MAG: zinc metalloprotease HtpX [bacterium]|nr:zinc metalloprotease HtpX [Acidimicrobiia bacterium]MCY4651346.1 zinc metalloprotease HtpX [bacterium]